MSRLAAATSDLRVIVCAGSGGVGKTTVAAALAVGLAHRGRRVALVTIDPARRLADALGVAWLGNDPAPVALGPGARGSLDALMLDAQRTFDDLVGTVARDAATRRAILSNRIYRDLTAAATGSEAFSAMTRLHDLVASGRWDVVVLDTPPTRDAQRFLDAPDDLERFLHGAALRALLAPTRHGARLLDQGARMLQPVVRRLTGTRLLEDLRAFFAAIDDVLGGLRERAVVVRRLLADPATGFVVVCTPQDAEVDEAARFAAQLRAGGYALAGVVVNQVQPLDARADAGAARERLLDAGLPSQLAARVLRGHAAVQVLARRDRDAVRRIGRRTGVTPVVVAARSAGVHDVAALHTVAAELLHAGQTAPS